MGAVSYYLAFGGVNRLQLIAVSMSTSVIGTQLLIYFNLINKEHLPYTTHNIPIFSHLLGGIIFGIGMMLASGCPTQQCINLGKGNLKSLLSIPLIAVSTQIAISGSLSNLRLYINNLITISYPDINIYYNLSGMTIGILLVIFSLMWVIKTSASKSIMLSILKYGSAIGLIVVAMWYICGNLAFVPENEITLDYAYLGNSSRNIQSLSMILPYAYLFDWLMYSSDSMRVLNANTMLIIGLILGSFMIYILSKKSNANSNLQFFKTPKDFIQYFFGSIFMGIGGVFALGCSIGQGLSGFSTLNLGSLVSIIGMYIGAKIIYKHL